MLLALDIGNSTIVSVVFENESIAARGVYSSTVQRTPEETWDLIQSLLTQNNIPSDKIKAAGISSVVTYHTTLFTSLIQEKLQLKPIVVNSALNLGIRIKYDKPEQLGPDRICAAVAGYAKFGGPLIVVDFGTATTYGVLDAQGFFLGGSISLGVKTTADTLFSRTAHLPHIELAEPPQAICTDTVAAMQAGVMFGVIDAVEGMVNRINHELGAETKVIATGGLSALVSNQTGIIDACEPDLVPHGIRIICGRNQGVPKI